MRWIKTVADEVFRLFVDDGPFAAAILAWLLLVGLAVSWIGPAPVWGAAGLFLGLAAIFVESVARRARQSRSAVAAETIGKLVQGRGR